MRGGQGRQLSDPEGPGACREGEAGSGQGAAFPVVFPGEENWEPALLLLESGLPASPVFEHSGPREQPSSGFNRLGICGEAALGRPGRKPSLGQPGPCWARLPRRPPLQPGSRAATPGLCSRATYISVAWWAGGVGEQVSGISEAAPRGAPPLTGRLCRPWADPPSEIQPPRSRGSLGAARLVEFRDLKLYPDTQGAPEQRKERRSAGSPSSWQHPRASQRLREQGGPTGVVSAVRLCEYCAGAWVCPLSLTMRTFGRVQVSSAERPFTWVCLFMIRCTACIFGKDLCPRCLTPQGTSSRFAPWLATRSDRLAKRFAGLLHHKNALPLGS